MADRRPQESNRATNEGPQIRNALAKAARLLASESHVVLKTRNEHFKKKVITVNIYNCNHGLINYTDTKAKCHHLKNWPVWGCLAILYLVRYRVLNSCRIWSPTGLCPHTVCIYCTLTQGRGEGGGRVEPEKRLEGQQFTKLTECISTSL